MKTNRHQDARKHRQRGTTLIEIIGSFVLLGIILGGVIELSETSLYNATYAKKQLAAVAIAKEHMGLFKEHLTTNPGTTLLVKTIDKSFAKFTVTYQLSPIGSYNDLPSPVTQPYHVSIEAMVYDYNYNYTDLANAPKAKKATVIVSWE